MLGEIQMIFILIVLLFSTILHEIAHGSMALFLGDPTAKEANRLTLNPLEHLDPFGSFIFPLFLFIFTQGKGPIIGWAKPVPINPYNFRDQKWGTLKVALAGPLANFSLAIFFALLIRFFRIPQNLLIFFAIISFYNFAWGIFNLVPLPPLDGSHILFRFLPERYLEIKNFLRQYSIFLQILFVLFFLDWIFWGAGFLYLLFSGQLPLI